MLCSALITRRAFNLATQTASTSQALPALSRSFHLTASLNETHKIRKARLDKKKNIQKQQLNDQSLKARPDPVLGHSNTRKGRKLWENSDLCKILLTESKLLDAQTRELSTAANSIPLSEHLNFGIKAQEEELIFQTLPEVAAQQAFFRTTNAQYDRSDAHAAKLQACESKATVNAIHLARLADLRNASAAGIAVENRRRCVETFSLPEKPHDPGRPEVQAAILTVRIRNVDAHLKRATHDIHNRRSLRILVHKRAKVLRHLKKLDPARYKAILPRLGLEAAAVEGELIVK